MPWVEWPDVQYIDAVNQQFRDTGIVVPFSEFPSISMVQSVTNNTQSTTRPRLSDCLSLGSLVVPTYMATTTTPADGTVLIRTTGLNPTSALTSDSFISTRVRTRLTLSSSFKAEQSILGVDLG